MAAPLNWNPTIAEAREQAAVVAKTGPVESRINAELRRLQSDMDDVESAVGGLFDRLQGVLSPDQPAEEANGAPDQLESPVVEELKRRRRQAQRLLESIEELKARLQV